MSLAPAPLAEVTRADRRAGHVLVESRHVGHAVVVGPDGEVEVAVGDPDRPTFVRSAAKPFQATACLELLDTVGPRPDLDEVAVAWASHRAEPVHLAAVRKLLARSGTSPAQLTCAAMVGEHDPGAAPARITCDCSGKHALFALAGLEQGTPRDRLLDPGAPLQRAVLALLEDVLGPVSAVGVDGCGAPAVEVPLARLAGGFAAIAAGGRFARVRDAGFAHPHLVGGAGRLETALLGAGVAAKPGAEGVFAAGWIARDGAPRGLALKVEDGASRAAAVASLALLVARGAVAADVWAPDPILGGGVPQGVVRAAATLTTAAPANVPT